MELSIAATLALGGVAFFADLVSSIAGSGGLLTLPALPWAGLPPLSFLATNKLQSAMGTLSSVTNFRRHGYLYIADDGILRFDAGHAVLTALIERTVDARHYSVAGVVGRVFFIRAKNG